MRIRIIPTKICSCCALALTPASPTIPIARPAAYQILKTLRIYKGWETAAKSGGEVLVALVIGVIIDGDYWLRSTYLIRLTLSLEDDGNDETIDTQDTSHNNGDDWLEDKFGLEDTHAWNTDSTLSSSIGCTQVYQIVRINMNLLAKTRAAAIPIYPKKVAWALSIRKKWSESLLLYWGKLTIISNSEHQSEYHFQKSFREILLIAVLILSNKQLLLISNLLFTHAQWSAFNLSLHLHLSVSKL